MPLLEAVSPEVGSEDSAQLELESTHEVRQSPDADEKVRTRLQTLNGEILASLYCSIRYGFASDFFASHGAAISFLIVDGAIPQSHAALITQEVHRRAGKAVHPITSTNDSVARLKAPRRKHASFEQRWTNEHERQELLHEADLLPPGLISDVFHDYLQGESPDVIQERYHINLVRIESLVAVARRMCNQLSHAAKNQSV